MLFFLHLVCQPVPLATIKFFIHRGLVFFSFLNLTRDGGEGLGGPFPCFGSSWRFFAAGFCRQPNDHFRFKRVQPFPPAAQGHHSFPPLPLLPDRKDRTLLSLSQRKRSPHQFFFFFFPLPPPWAPIGLHDVS